jgi:hypothetical protein
MDGLKRSLLVVAVGLAVAFVIGIAWVGEKRNQRLYAEGLAAEEAADWQTARALWTPLREYRDCAARAEVAACHIAVADATEAFQKHNYDRAAALLVVWQPGHAGARDRLPASLAKRADELFAEAKRRAEERRERERHNEATVAWRAGDAAYRIGDWAAAVDRYELARQLDSQLQSVVAMNLKQARAALQRQQEQERKTAELRRLRQIAADMKTWDTGTGSVALGVTAAKITTSAGQYYTRGNYRFVEVCAAVSNRGTDITHVNPNDFTLETPDGFTVSHDTSTYSLSNYFDAVDLRAGGQTSGWLIFCLPKEREYTLNYQGFSGTAQKRIAFP